ncbi:alpha/beta hydrolase [Lactobacillus sp. ESL0684]|uniref:alpha/beta fold hydrolase n=1 Tax=Lactobacillus sp. ESL0684 TaxID=2983213 RepID=UPI0023F73B7C|nr:alpha/beta hydrolase [Lactobacillus sp. ESL0684]WEV44422.1 alpha/beta hydrolase [Lactobacillus sp. ESL0684]
MEFRTNDGVKIHYYDTQTAGQPIVAIPGIGGYSRMWLKVAQLFKKDFRFILIDPRNQGQSERTYQGQRISRHALDLAELLQKLDLQQVIGIGNSMGAANLWSYLSLFGSKRFCAMIDLDQPPKMIRDETWSYGFKDLTWHNYPEYLKVDFGNPFFARIDEEMFDLARQEARDFPYQPSDNYLCLIDHAHQDWRDVLIDIDIPLLVLAGENSPLFDYHFALAMQELSPLIEAKIIANCGHLIQAEQPREMYDEVMRFLNSYKGSD